VFSAGECRLKLSEAEDARRADLVACPRCVAAGRRGLVRVLDVISPDVFVSGHHAVGAARRGVVDRLLRGVELAADVVCSNRSGAGEALSRLEECRFVVVLLSDAYAASRECRAELRAAVGLCLPLVPILMPDVGLTTDGGASLGWRGPGPADRRYWRHAADAHREWPAAPGEPATNWGFLEHFTPLVWAAVPGAAEDDAASEDAGLSRLADEAARCITARLERPGRVDAYSDFSMLGVRLSYFREFIDRNGGRERFAGMTTDRVMKEIVFPATKECGLSFCEMLASEGRGEVVGTAEWFYSHAWRYLFLDVVDAAERFFGARGSGQDPVVWFDVFSVSQHKAGVRPFEWWSSVFLNSVGAIGRVLMLMQPFADEGSKTEAWVTLRRVWCVFETHACEATRSEFHVTMTERMSARFVGALLAGDGACLAGLAALDCERSEAFKREDREQVFGVIRRTTGFALLNSAVMLVLERWLLSELAALRGARGGGGVARLLEALVGVVERFQVCIYV
jgi:hypothetical protein